MLDGVIVCAYLSLSFGTVLAAARDSLAHSTESSGESETAVDALIECEESVPAVYPSDEVKMYLRQNGELVACVDLSTSQVDA